MACHYPMYLHYFLMIKIHLFQLFKILHGKKFHISPQSWFAVFQELCSGGLPRRAATPHRKAPRDVAQEVRAGRWDDLIWDEAGETVGLGDAEQHGCLSWGFLMILMEDMATIGNYTVSVVDIC